MAKFGYFCWGVRPRLSFMLLDSIDLQGWASVGPLLTREECVELRGSYAEDGQFRATVNLQRYRFGQGEYRYFAYPLPPPIDRLRQRLYLELAPLANRWNEMLRLPFVYPATLDAFLEACHAAGQCRPTPLLLRYGPGDYNCLHQDLYGFLAFPFQVLISLSEPGREFSGGQFILVEQRPRAQSMAQALLPGQGEGIVFTNRYCPRRGAVGYHRVNIRHGVSPVTAGERFTLGVIFHDAA